MNAIELFHADGRTAGIYFCKKCRIVSPNKEEADRCCTSVKCADCGSEEVRKYHTVCDPCRDKKEREREAARFANAEKVTDWSGAIYSEGHGWNEGFFANLEDLEDWLACEEEDNGSQPDRPEYVWTCDDKPFCHLDYDHIIENATQEAYEDWEPDSITGADVLKAAIEVFNEANKEHVSWEPNYKRALLLPPLAERSGSSRAAAVQTTRAHTEPAAVGGRETRSGRLGGNDEDMQRHGSGAPPATEAPR